VRGLGGQDEWFDHVLAGVTRWDLGVLLVLLAGLRL
jgi:hypothetical protein